MVSAAERGQVLRAIITKGKKNLTGGGGLAATVQVLWQAHPPPAPQSQHNPPQHLFAVCSKQKTELIFYDVKIWISVDRVSLRTWTVLNKDPNLHVHNQKLGMNINYEGFFVCVYTADGKDNECNI
ncbi:hypothetical protein OUZ56_009342 [Daphnia magna]|uniref:Uncharacterized protein n=1 Tax=Daphnia magna TaxID=35525 RepID=A0ABR0AFV2_9CRUS|nr:hypothetical protein OUZ56_009342 [Daphnia magna]